MGSSDLGSFLRNARKARAMTQLSVAERLRVSPQAVSKWERNECMPDIMLLPHIADILEVSVEDILYAGGAGNSDSGDLTGDISTEITKVLNSFVDNRLFDKICRVFESARSVAELQISPEVFLILNSKQKDILLDTVLILSDYEILLEEIFQYIGTAHRARVITRILDAGDYKNLESLIPVMPRYVYNEVIKHLLEKNCFEFLEDILPLMNREQKDLIVNKIVEEQVELDIVESFLPFFDVKQRKRVQEWRLL